MNDNQLRDIVAGGAETVEEIAAEADLSVGHTYRVCKDAAENGVLRREKFGHEWRYFVPDDAGPAPATEGEGVMPVARGYEWDEHVPDETVEYIPHDGELDELTALIETREQTGQPVRALIGGPTGCGKTTLAEYIAAERGWPMFVIQGKYTLREKDLLGSPTIVGGETRWVDGVLTKALLASAERPVVLLIDEANRARAQAKSALFSALDHRATVTLDGGRGGETIRGDELNLVVIATINEGPGYMVERMDAAEKRRYGAKWNVDYLGIEYPEREAELVAERTGADEAFAEALVTTANQIRQQAADTSSAISVGVPTSAVISWAATAVAFEGRGVDNPVVRAANAQVVRPFYDEGSEADAVTSIVTANLDGAPVAGYAEWQGDPTTLTCDACGWETRRTDATDDVVATMTCPECGGALTQYSNADPVTR